MISTHKTSCSIQSIGIALMECHIPKNLKMDSRSLSAKEEETSFRINIQSSRQLLVHRKCIQIISLQRVDHKIQ
jgi:hypothetical protein